MKAMGDGIVRARVDRATKIRAEEVLRELGLTTSALIRLTLRRVAADGAVPFDLRLPNHETLQAIEQLEAGKGATFTSVADLMNDLHAED